MLFLINKSNPMKKQFKTMHIASLELFLVAAENENFSVTAEYLNITCNYPLK